jgi:hypothetical protein
MGCAQLVISLAAHAHTIHYMDCTHCYFSAFLHCARTHTAIHYKETCVAHTVVLSLAAHIHYFCETRVAIQKCSVWLLAYAHPST